MLAAAELVKAWLVHEVLPQVLVHSPALAGTPSLDPWVVAPFASAFAPLRAAFASPTAACRTDRMIIVPVAADGNCMFTAVAVGALANAFAYAEPLVPTVRAFYETVGRGTVPTIDGTCPSTVVLGRYLRNESIKWLADLDAPAASASDQGYTRGDMLSLSLTQTSDQDPATLRQASGCADDVDDAGVREVTLLRHLQDMLSPSEWGHNAFLGALSAVLGVGIRVLVKGETCLTCIETYGSHARPLINLFLDQMHYQTILMPPVGVRLGLQRCHVKGSVHIITQ